MQARRSRSSTPKSQYPLHVYIRLHVYITLRTLDTRTTLLCTVIIARNTKRTRLDNLPRPVTDLFQYDNPWTIEIIDIHVNDRNAPKGIEMYFQLAMTSHPSVVVNASYLWLANTFMHSLTCTKYTNHGFCALFDTWCEMYTYIFLTCRKRYK